MKSGDLVATYKSEWFIIDKGERWVTLPEDDTLIVLDARYHLRAVHPIHGPGHFPGINPEYKARVINAAG